MIPGVCHFVPSSNCFIIRIKRDDNHIIPSGKESLGPGLSDELDFVPSSASSDLCRMGAGFLNQNRKDRS